MSWKNRAGSESTSRRLVSKQLALFLCAVCFFAGMLFTHRVWTDVEDKGLPLQTGIKDEQIQLFADNCDPKIKDVTRDRKDIIREVSKTHNAVQTLDKTISNSEMELAAARALQDSILTRSPLSDDLVLPEHVKKRKYLMVVGINTTFSTRKRRDSVRATWMPQEIKHVRVKTFADVEFHDFSEGILNGLGNISPSSLFEQLFLSLLSSGGAIVEGRVSSNEFLYKMFKECKVLVCQSKSWVKKANDICQWRIHELSQVGEKYVRYKHSVVTGQNRSSIMGQNRSLEEVLVV